MNPELIKTHWATADKLRANMDAAEYKHIVLGLIFVKYISDTFQTHGNELRERFGDPDDEYYIGDADDETLICELEDRDYYREVNVFWVPEAARWENIRAQAKQPDIGKRIDDALTLIEAENPKLKGILDKRYARVQLPDGKLGELVDMVSTIGFGVTGESARDILGQVYEYFLGQFASAEGKRGGQFYTPASIVRTLVAILAPHHGQVYDPCCGSGGMFVQIPACLWFLAKQKSVRQGEVLFIDARKLGTMISRVQIEFSDEDIQRIADTVHAWRGEIPLNPPLPKGEAETIPPFTKGGTRGDLSGHSRLLPQRAADRDRRAWPCPDAGALCGCGSGGG